MGRSSFSSEVKKPSEKDLSSSTFVNQGKQASMKFVIPVSDLMFYMDKPPVL